MSSTHKPPDPENWRALIQSGLYLVSRDGRLWSLLNGRELKTKVSKVGYRNANIGQGVGTKFVHILVAEAWLGPKPTPQHVVDHVDENRLNNSVDNLAWVTRKQNTQRAVASGTMKQRLRGRKAYLTADQVCEARKEARNGTSFSQLGIRFNVDPGTIRSAVYGVTYSDVDELPLERRGGRERPGAGGRTHQGPLRSTNSPPEDFVEIVQGEQWKRLVGDLQGYWVSNMGRVFSAKTRRIKKPQVNSAEQGYLRIQLQAEDGQPRSFMLHRLVADYFLAPPERPGLIVGHLNENPQDPRAANLAWLSRTENAVRASVAKRKGVEVLSLHDFIASNTVVEHRPEFKGDALIPNAKLLVCYDHIPSASETGGGVSRFSRVRAMDALWKDRGIRTIRVWSSEWLKKPDLVKSALMHKLGMGGDRIYARDTEVREVSVPVAGAFLEANHLQGTVGSAVKLGLFRDDVLVALATFGKPRFGGAEEGDVELLRFAVAQGMSVVGGFSRLLRQFIRQHQPKKIMSFADRRWSSGGVYEASGFRLLRASDPNYFYFKPPDEVLHSRVAFQKHKLPTLLPNFDPARSEVENMIANGWDRIWDCGNLVYEMDLSKPEQR